MIRLKLRDIFQILERDVVDATDDASGGGCSAVDAHAPSILTPDQRVRVFVSSTLDELADERAAVRRAIERLRLTPVMFELGARPYPPRNLYLAYLRQSHVFVGIYGEQYGWVAPDMDVSGLEDELQHAGGIPMLLYVKLPALGRHPRLTQLIAHLEQSAGVSYKTFTAAEELEAHLVDDLAVLMTERFTAGENLRSGVHVPRPASEFVGRWTELSELVELLSSDGVRLVTLTGPGGIGKTRLAIEAARALVDRFPDGVTFIALASRGPDDFLEAVGAGLGLRDVGQEPLPRLVAEYLRTRRQLLILDNFEQLLAVAECVASLIEETESLRVLVTSRTALRLSGEEEFPVPPLGLPRVTSRADEVARAEAVQLFVRRVAAVRHRYELTGQDAAMVARICRRLDGLPLALELVAARANVMSIEELGVHLDKVLDLSARAPDVPARQRTLRQTMDWSYGQLPAEAAEVFARLGVFAGSFTLTAAQAICDVDENTDLLDVVATLVDHSLLRPDLDSGTSRFSMLEIVRQYACQRLDPEASALTKARHAAYYRDVAITASTGLRGASQRAMIDRLDSDGANIAAALDWLLATGRRSDVADMCWSMWIYHWLRNSMTEARRWTRGALSAEGPLAPLQRGRLLATDGFLAGWRGDHELAAAELGEAVAIADREADDDLRLHASIMSIVVLGAVGDMEGARSLGERAVVLARESHDRWSEAVALLGLGWLDAAAGRFAECEPRFAEMFTATQESQDPLVMAMALDEIAELRTWQNVPAEAASLLIESLNMLAEVRMAYSGLATLHSAAWLLTRVGDWAGAVRVQSAADAVADGINAHLWPPWAPRHDQLLADARQHLGEAAFAEAWRDDECTFERAAYDAIAALTPLMGESTSPHVAGDPA